MCTFHAYLTQGMLKVPTKYHYYHGFSPDACKRLKRTRNKFLPGTHLLHLSEREWQMYINILLKTIAMCSQAGNIIPFIIKNWKLKYTLNNKAPGGYYFHICIEYGPHIIQVELVFRPHGIIFSWFSSYSLSLRTKNPKCSLVDWMHVSYTQTISVGVLCTLKCQ